MFYPHVFPRLSQQRADVDIGEGIEIYVVVHGRIEVCWLWFT